MCVGCAILELSALVIPTGLLYLPSRKNFLLRRVWVAQFEEVTYKSSTKCLVAFSWQPSVSVLKPEWSKNRTLDFSKWIREDIQSKTSEAR